ncbi:MAG: cysteine-rich small domain-containing protein [Methanospirillum sp.]
MRYYTKEGALLLRGISYAAGTGLPSGGRACTALLLAPASASCPAMPGVELAAARHGLDPAASCGLVTDADVAGTVVVQYDRTTAFALADGDSVALIAWTAAHVPPADAEGLLEAIAAACPVRPAGLVLASDEEEGEVRLEPLREAAAAAVREALARRGASREGPAFLIYSRFGGGHWVAWSAEGCPYYPCHHREGQRCDFCYCPLYPCGDPSLGEEVASSTVGAVWNCSACTLLHEPAVADHLRRNPMASLAELKRVASRR